MSDDDVKNREAVIRDAVEAETRDALARFKESRFEERLEEKVRRARATGSPPRRGSFFRAWPRPVWLAAGVLLIVVCAYLGWRSLRPSAPAGEGAVVRVLRRLPAMRTIEHRRRETGARETPGAAPAALDSQITAALANGLSAPGRAVGRRREADVNPIPAPAGPLPIDEIYDILVGRRSVERALSAISQIAKEG